MCKVSYGKGWGVVYNFLNQVYEDVPNFLRRGSDCTQIFITVAALNYF